MNVAPWQTGWEVRLMTEKKDQAMSGLYELIVGFDGFEN